MGARRKPPEYLAGVAVFSLKTTSFFFFYFFFLPTVLLKTNILKKHTESQAKVYVKWCCSL